MNTQNINQWFHMVANEGLAISQLRNQYKEKGKYLSAKRIETLLLLRQLKQNFFKK